MPELLNQTLNFSFDFIVIIYVLLFSLFFVLFVFLLGVLFSKFRQTPFNKDIEEQSYKRALFLLDKAKRQSLQVYEDAQQRAKKILAEAYEFKADSSESLDAHLKNLTDTQIKEFEGYLKESLQGFEQSLNKEAQENIKVLDDVSNTFQTEVSKGIKDLKDNIVSETLESQKLVDQKMKEEYEQVEKELKDYREKKLTMIDEKIGEIITNIATRAIGESLSIADHQDLILKILEEEKEKGSLTF